MKRIQILILIIFTIACSAEQQPDVVIPQNAFDINPLLIGETIPNITVADINGEDELLLSRISGTYSILVFYRGGWCPFCTSHLSDLAQYEEEIYDLGYRLIGISPDRSEFLRESLDDMELKYTLLSDSSMELTRAFGLAYREDDEVVSELKEHGMDIVESSGYEHKQLPVPAVYIVDREGKVLFQYVNPDYRERINGDILMAALRSLAE